MSLYKQPGCRNWYFKITTKSGQVIRRTTGTDDRDKAVLVENIFRLAVNGQTPVDKLHQMLDAVCDCQRPATPLSEIMPLYSDALTTLGRTIGKRTYENRQIAVHRLTGWIRDNHPAADSIEAVDHAVALRFAQHLTESGLKTKTRRNLIDDLSTVWRTIEQTHPHLSANPWPRVRPQVTDGETGKPFTRTQEKAVFAAAERAGKGWPLACLLARHTGLRYSSVARLKWDEVDLDVGVIRHTPPKTSRHKIRVTVPLVGTLLAALRTARQEAPGEVYVLPLHAKAYHRRTLKSGPGAFAPILAAAKVGEGYTFHSWRHTFRTRLSEAGVADDIAKRLGGWTEDATAALYDHADRIPEIRAALESAK